MRFLLALVAIAALLVPIALADDDDDGGFSGPISVEVTNLPAVQAVAGAVEVLNLPATQTVTGSVEVTNLPNSTPARMQLVGFTQQEIEGTLGVFALTHACQAEFGEESRLCELKEAFNTSDIPDGLAGDAWIRLDLESNSGFFFNTCIGLISGNQNPVLEASGQARTDRSCFEPRSVACCAPVP